MFLNNKLFKIINYKKPITKYFVYPHLLMLPNIDHYCKPLYFLNTTENLDNLSEHLCIFNVKNTIILESIIFN